MTAPAPDKSWSAIAADFIRSTTGHVAIIAPPQFGKSTLGMNVVRHRLLGPGDYAHLSHSADRAAHIQRIMTDPPVTTIFGTMRSQLLGFRLDGVVIDATNLGMPAYGIGEHTALSCRLSPTARILWLSDAWGPWQQTILRLSFRAPWNVLHARISESVSATDSATDSATEILRYTLHGLDTVPVPNHISNLSNMAANVGAAAYRALYES